MHTLPISPGFRGFAETNPACAVALEAFSNDRFLITWRIGNFASRSGIKEMIIGYARVSTDEQTPVAQIDALRAAGCTKIYEERASGGSRARPELLKLMKRIIAGDVVIVARLDRLARSLQHLLEVIEILTARGAFFRSLNDPIDTASPQGRFSLQVLGAVAELERALIRERTIAGLDAARARGRVGGNPALKAGNPAARQRLAQLRRETHLQAVTASANDFLPIVRRLRPAQPWNVVLRAVNAESGGRPWTLDRLKRAVKRLVGEGLAEAALLKRTPRQGDRQRAVYLVAGLVRTNPDITLAELAKQLEAMRVRTPRGKVTWSTSSVKVLRDRARLVGL